MKRIKITMLILLILSAASFTKGQEYKIAAQNTKDGRLILKQFTGDLPVEGYSGNEIIIVSAAEDFSPPDRAKGLKPIYPGGSDNSGLGLNVEKTGNQVSITCLLPITRKADYRIKVPDNIALEIESGCDRSSNTSVTGMKNEIEIKCCHDIKISNVTGPLVLSTIAGDIDITFSNLVNDKPFSVNSVSGDIDITLPVKTATNLELRTVSGGFYSDFEITDTQRDLKKVGGSQLMFPLNGGGFKFSVASVSGNVYIRKGN